MSAGPSFWEGLAPRERRLVGALGVVAALFLFGFLPFLLVRRLHQREAEIQEIEDVAATLVEQREVVAKRRASQAGSLARYAKPAPQLQRYLDELTAQAGLSAAEVVDRPEVPHGKRFTERSTLLKLHKVGLVSVVRFLESIAKSPHPVAVNKLSLKPRSGEPDQYELELVVSAYDRKDGAPGGAPGAGSAAPAASAAPDDGGDE